MENQEYKEFSNLVENKYRGVKSVSRWNAGALKNANNDLKALNEAISACYKKDENGKYIPMGKERLERVRKQYAKTLRSVSKARDPKSETDILNTIYSVLKNDAQTVIALTEESVFPEDFRRDVIAFDDLTAKTMKGLLSERIPISYTDDEGVEHKGFFTEESLLIRNNFWDEIVKKAGSQEIKQSSRDFLSTLFQSPEFYQKCKTADGVRKFCREIEASSLRIYQEKYKAYGEDVGRQKADEEVWRDFFKQLDFEPELIASLEKNKEGLFNDALRDFIEKFVDIRDEWTFKYNENLNIQLYLKDMKINMNDNITDRNCAMTQIAQLVGRDDLLARAVPMDICVGGRKRRGVFMEEAKGYNLEQWQKTNKTQKRLNDMTPTAWKDLADLQMIDYICGNVDRHTGNMIYQFNKDGKLEHVKGIDHDLSFGYIPKDEEKKKLPKVENMMAVSSSMADRINNLTPEQFELMLCGLDLPEKQKKAAWDRVLYMRKQLAKAKTVSEHSVNDFKLGELHIIPDDLWICVKPYNMLKFIHIGPGTTDKEVKEKLDDAWFLNYFYRCLCEGTSGAIDDKNKTVSTNVNMEREYNHGKLVSLPFSVNVMKKNEKTINDIMKQLTKTLDKAGIEKRGREFKDMYHSVQELQKWFKKNKENEVTQDEKSNLQQLYRQTVQMCETYIQTHNPYSSVGKMRQGAAIKLMEFIGMQGCEVNYDLTQQKKKQMQKEQALSDLEEMSKGENLSNEDKEKAVSLMKTVVKLGKQLGASKEELTEKIAWGKGMSVDQLKQEDIQSFVKKEKNLFKDEQPIVEKTVDKSLHREYNSMVK